jgi:hypothetical protein
MNLLVEGAGWWKVVLIRILGKGSIASKEESHLKQVRVGITGNKWNRQSTLGINCPESPRTMSLKLG